MEILFSSMKLGIKIQTITKYPLYNLLVKINIEIYGQQ